MAADRNNRKLGSELLFASAMLATGLVISALSFNQIRASDRQHLAQATQPLQSTPGAETKPAAPTTPSDPVTTGTRPSAVPPEPARPDAEAQKAGAQPALPLAPAEKTAPAIQQK
jgi:hypothetical protein